MTGSVIFLESHHGGLPAVFASHKAAGRLRSVAEHAFDEAEIATCTGVIISMHADQIALAQRADVLERMLARGGRILFNGHVRRPVLVGLAPFEPSGHGTLADLLLVAQVPHPIFAGIERGMFQYRRGVAGFYGRGHNPPLPGAITLTTVGTRAAPLDWVWHHPGGGAFFSHAGNDIWTTADDAHAMARLAANIVAWCGGETAA